MKLSKSHIVGWAFPTLLLIYLSTACAPSVTYVVDVAYTPALKEQLRPITEPLQIAVMPFDDQRADKKGIGKRSRLTGQVDEFEIRPYPASTAVTEALISALKIHGYQTKLLSRGTDETSITVAPPHIILSGKIEELRADAVSKPGYTDIKTSVRLKVRVYRVDDRSSSTMTIQSQTEPRVALFNPNVMQSAINEALTEAINKLIAQKLKP
ncbi:MAG: hypothetical protein HZA12_04765 [Nitrospirae bacterium]|nr:hypothetical protein [Nitrospirota bacterium]